MSTRTQPTYATNWSLLKAARNLVAIALAFFVLAQAIVTCSSSTTRYEADPDSLTRRLGYAQFVATAYEDLAVAIDGVYVQPLTAPRQFGKDAQSENLYTCRTGRPREGTSYIDSNRQMGCLALVVNLSELYRQTESEAAYEAAVRAANYYLTEYPNQRRKFGQLVAAQLDDFLPRP